MSSKCKLSAAYYFWQRKHFHNKLHAEQNVCCHTSWSPPPSWTPLPPTSFNLRKLDVTCLQVYDEVGIFCPHTLPFLYVSLQSKSAHLHHSAPSWGPARILENAWAWSSSAEREARSWHGWRGAPKSYLESSHGYLSLSLAYLLDHSLV